MIAARGSLGVKGTLGRYQLLDELGRGAMGTVYRAADPLIGREVAIKTLHATFPEEMMQDLRERFLREARSAGKLSHPNIVTVYDVGEHEGIAYIAMELLPGRSLQQMLRAGPALPLETAVDFAAQLADALDHAHESAVVHRDVKPANVIVSPAGRCKLTDFGVAHLASSTMTQAGDALGTPRYMSPEQALGQKPDTRSDIFSLGIVLYEMLVRRTPFERAEDTSPYVLMHRIAGEPHPPLRKADPRMPAALERIIHRAELHSQPGSEVVIDGDDPVAFGQDFWIIPTPGHTRGHSVLLYKQRYLFTGDHLWADDDATLGASKTYNWHSWPEQKRSLRKLLDHPFAAVLPGHGRRLFCSENDMHQLLQALVDQLQKK